MVSPRRLLLVETDPPLRRLIEQVASPISAITVTADFPAGRAALISGQFDLVVANVRLRAYNGLHLLYLAKAASLPTRTILYSDPVDPFLVSEAHRAGGFYESMARLPYSLPAYIRAELPPVDRRDPMTPDRRLTFRGGRRCSDVPLSAPRPAWT